MNRRYSGRDFSEQEISFIRELIATNPALGRTHLSKLICEEFGWLKENGGLKDVSCRVALLRMEKDDLITLPSRQSKNGQAKVVLTAKSVKPLFVPEIKDLDAVTVTPVQNAAESRLWNEYIKRFHYLGYKKLPGAQIRYFVWYDNHPISCLGFGASAWKVLPRDKFIGWDIETRKARLHLIINNARFLILPWIHRKNLASKILSLTSKRIADDWQSLYSYRPVLMETFVQSDRFQGTCYQASNWTCVGKTKGRGKLDTHFKRAQPIKQIWLRPLDKKFRSVLCAPLASTNPSLS